MAATGTPTPNIGLRRPQGTDPASVDDINYNSNIIDTKLGAVGNTSVQEQINSLNSNIVQKFRTVTSGSLHDIKTSGIYYLTGLVADKPTGNGGIYIVSAYNADLLVGLFSNIDGLLYNIRCVSGQWYSTKL